MPTYGYQCKKCSHTFEIFQKISDKPIKECEKCDGKVNRLLYPVGILFKGSGFHINDYRKPEKKKESGNTDTSTPKEQVKSSADSK